MELIFNIYKQVMTRADNLVIASHSKKVHSCSFTFSEEWQGMTKSATFKKNHITYDVLLDNDTCTIPSEVLRSAGAFEVGVYGSDGQKTITSNLVSVEVVAGSPTEGLESHVTPSMYEQIIDKINSIEKGDVDPEAVGEIVADYIETNKEELKGDSGSDGESAYQSAVANGFEGTKEEWLASLKGEDGSAGASAYEIAVENGYEGTKEEWAQGLEKIQNLSLRTGEGTNSIAMNNPNTVSTGAYSIAEGNGTRATANSAHAEGTATQATGVQAHSEGDRSQATRNAAHAEGYVTKATGNYSHSQNQGTIAKGVGQTAIGAYNIEQGSVTSKVNTDYAFIIGNGTDENNRSNALAVKWDGTLVFSDGSEIQSNYYVTPEMFGAVGDGVTNDLAAFQAALLQSRPIYLENKHYLIDGDLYITQPNTVIQGKCGAYSSTSPRLVFTNQHGIHIEQATYKMLFKGFAIFSDGTGLTMQGDGRIANLTFEDLYFKCRRDVFLDAETGYIYFKKCHFDFDPNTTFDGDLVKITYTGSSANRANYISFNQCEFEGQNIPNHLTDINCYLIHLDNCSNINITASDICNCYNAIKFGTTGAAQFITLTNNYLWNIKTIANISSCLRFIMTGNSQYTPSGVQPLVFPNNRRGHVISGNIFDIGTWAAVSIENNHTIFENNYIGGSNTEEIINKLHIGEVKY